MKNLRLVFWPVFPRTTIVSQRKQYKVRFSLIFCFASVDSFKALTGCLEKLEVLAKRFGLKKNFHQSYSKTSVPTSSLHFIYTDIKSIFDRAMAWIALIFYWFDSIYQGLTSDHTGWPRGECGELFINMLCVREFEAHPWRVLFLWTPELSSVGTKTDVYLILLVTHQKTCQVTKNWRKNWHANIEVRLSRIVKQPNIEKFQVFHEKNWMANVIHLPIKPFKARTFEKLEVTFLA